VLPCRKFAENKFNFDGENNMIDKMIRTFEQADLEQVMSIWLSSNLDTHTFIDAAYWKENYDYVRKLISDATIFVYEINSEIAAFVGLEGTYIAGIFVKKEFRSQGIGKELLDCLKKQYDNLSLDVFLQNVKAIRFYERENFQIISKKIDEDTGALEYTMQYVRE